jgi:hypothetical protein
MERNDRGEGRTFVLLGLENDEVWPKINDMVTDLEIVSDQPARFLMNRNPGSDEFQVRVMDAPIQLIVNNDSKGIIYPGEVWTIKLKV